MNKKITLGLFVLTMSNITISTAALTIQEQFFDAIIQGNRDDVKSLLVNKASLSDTNQSGSTPLHFAVLFDRLDIVQFLIKVGAIVNAHNKRDGNTPLHDAVDERNADMVKLLLDNKADVNLKNHDNNTPLQEAQKKGLIDIVPLLEAAAQSQKINPLLNDEKELIKNNKKVGKEIIQQVENAKENKRAESISPQKNAISVMEQRKYNKQLLNAAKNEKNQEIQRLLKAGAQLEAVNKNG